MDLWRNGKYQVCVRSFTAFSGQKISPSPWFFVPDRLRVGSSVTEHATHLRDWHRPRNRCGISAHTFNHHRVYLLTVASRRTHGTQLVHLIQLRIPPQVNIHGLRKKGVQDLFPGRRMKACDQGHAHWRQNQVWTRVPARQSQRQTPQVILPTLRLRLRLRLKIPGTQRKNTMPRPRKVKTWIVHLPLRSRNGTAFASEILRTRSKRLEKPWSID